MMCMLGPLPMSLVVLLVALAIAALVARQFVVPLPGQPAIKPLSTFLDMLMVGVLAARLAFVLAWWPQYLADPWSIVRIGDGGFSIRSEEHTSELQSLMRTSYAVFCLNKKNTP